MASSMQAVLSALNIFSSAPDKAALDSANVWLQDFQHSVNTFRVWSNVPPTLTSNPRPSP